MTKRHGNYPVGKGLNIVLVKPIILQIYLTAGNVYNLETKVQSLANKVKAVNALAEQDKMERLEDQVARTVAKVAHAEREVSQFVKMVCGDNFVFFLQFFKRLYTKYNGIKYVYLENNKNGSGCLI